MKITIYTVTDCTFSQEEKTYLKSKNIEFDEKNVEQNKEWLQEMLTVSNNFAGTPVTKIEKDDGQISVLKGFTKEEFDKALSLQAADQSAPTDSPSSPPPIAEEPAIPPAPSDAPAVPDAQPPVPPVVEPPAPIPPPQTPSVPPVNTDTPAPSAPPPIPPIQGENIPPTPQSTTSNDPLNSILDDIAKKSDNTQAPAQQPTPTSPQAPAVPNFPS